MAETGICVVSAVKTVPALTFTFSMINLSPVRGRIGAAAVSNKSLTDAQRRIDRALTIRIRTQSACWTDYSTTGTA